MVLGRVKDGVVVLEDSEEKLEEGALVVVRTVNPDDIDPDIELSPEDEAELLEAIAQADRGETVSHDEVMARLRAIREAHQG